MGLQWPLDYGNITLNGEKIHFFATPGHERFKVHARDNSQWLGWDYNRWLIIVGVLQQLRSV